MKIMAEKQQQRYYGTGRRKTSVARVFLRQGKGEIVVNKQVLNDYFGRETLRMIVNQPLVVTNTMGRFDIYATVKGGGNSGQAGAIRLGITRALIDYDETINPPPLPQEQIKKSAEEDESGDAEEGSNSGAGAAVAAVQTRTTFRRLLRAAGFVTRDSRIVERKKVGKHKARKGPQYSKR